MCHHVLGICLRYDRVINKSLTKTKKVFLISRFHFPIKSLKLFLLRGLGGLSLSSPIDLIMLVKVRPPYYRYLRYPMEFDVHNKNELDITTIAQLERRSK